MTPSLIRNFGPPPPETMVGTPDARASITTLPKVSVSEGKAKHIHVGVSPGERLSAEHARKFDSLEIGFKPGALRTLADDQETIVGVAGGDKRTFDFRQEADVLLRA